MAKTIKTTLKADLPATGFIRLSQLLTFIPISSATIWRRVRDKTFPNPIKLGPRTTAWKAEDVRAWIEDQGRAA
jgi:predicted DNA-binding transcriptional regulator AlpA